MTAACRTTSSARQQKADQQHERSALQQSQRNLHEGPEKAEDPAHGEPSRFHREEIDDARHDQRPTGEVHRRDGNQRETGSKAEPEREYRRGIALLVEGLP